MSTLISGIKGKVTMMMIRQNPKMGVQRIKRVGWLSATILGLFFASVISVRAADLLHNSADTASKKWQAQGGWGVTGGKYGKFDCATCHEPDAANLRNIRKTITTQNGESWPSGSPSVDVTFLNSTSMGYDKGGHAASSRICEVCHSANQFHNFNTANNTGGLSHPTPNAVCTSCHKHNTGFKAACGGCHGNPPTAAVLGGDYGLIGTPRASNAMAAGQVGAHATHTQTRNMVCDTCHYINNGTIKMPNLSNTIDIGFYGFGGKVTSGTYVPYSSTSRGYRIASGTANTTMATVVTSYANANKCSGVYCHGGGVKVGATQVKAPLTGGNNIAPQWTAVSQNQCGSCHGVDAASPPTMGSHVKHVVPVWSAQSGNCDLCHPAIDMSHVQGSLRWEMKVTDARVGANATYKGLDKGATGDLAPSDTYGQCTNVACHTDGKGGAPRLDATWGSSTFNADCSGCHGGNAGSSAPIASDMHGQHINQIGVNGVNFGCVECHAQTVTADRTIGVLGNHLNQLVNYSGARAGKNKAACNSAYCHSDGKGNAGMAVSWSGGTPIDNCIGCHGSASPADFASVYGEPNYASTGGGAARGNSHKKHVAAGSASCIYCHGGTVTGTGALTGANHIDMTIQVAPGGGESFGYPGGKTCSTISCHGSGSPNAVWGATLPADCTGCHGGNAAVAPNDIKTGQHTRHINNVSVNGVNYGCAECHAQTVNADLTISNSTLHVNKFTNYSGARAGKNTAACNAAYCHSDGKGSAGIAVNWATGPAIDNCTGCHGAASPADFASVYGEPNYAGTGSGAERANSHKKHVGTSGSSTCIYCHAGTVAVDGKLAGANHMDKSIQVSPGGGKDFGYPGGKTCSNITCHGAGSPDAVWGATMPVDCTGCHGGNSASFKPISSNMHKPHVSQSGLNGENYGCVECHAQTVNGDRLVSNQGNHGNQFPNYSGARAGKIVASCNASYCHGDGKGSAGMAVSWAGGTPINNCIGCHGAASPADFTSIAGEPNYANAGIGLYKANSHRSHTAAGASTCETCHINTVTTDGTAILGTGLHIDRSINVNFNTTKAGATANYDPVTRTCNNISCHGGGNPRWGDISAGCSACHPNPAGLHTVHIRDMLSAGMVAFYNFTGNRSVGTYYRFGCANCHPTDTAKHRNGQVEVTFNKNKAGAGYLTTLNNLVSDDTGGYTKGGANNFTCETVYCHSNGRTLSLVAGDYRQTPNWYGGSFGGNRCGGCHDNPPQYAGQSHYVAESSLGDNGTPPYAESGHMVGIHFMNTYVGNNMNGYLGYSSSGSMAHGNPALATTISCYTCHSGIVSSSQIDTYAMSGTSSNFRCEACHTSSSRTRLQPGEIVNASLHINGAKDVAFAPISIKTKAQLANVANALGWSRSGNYKADTSYDSADLSVATWNAQTKTCLTACHVNQPDITWGAQLKCVSCHANQ
ncbi:CxxxxCH/CxxCH domain c-type cytochrome [Geotalea uraniireducens]|uniref:Cytochrome C family protein n=1 Tax=Geotalea uraniireducens (strain Rf4) TaxID=351605 RepID=A5GDQ9_GEOUR|nr:CxxxxCH/CxxCH domain-containing protein [Geotalea uraniireducens]ABQ24292.1 cytochrome C family protein [Geotalea uraniireducens Rf4]